MIKQEKFTDAEMEDFAEMFNEILTQVCLFADMHNFDRDNILKYLSQRLDVFSEIATIRNYEINN